MASPAAWLSSAVEAADAATQALGLQEDITLDRGTADGFGSVSYDDSAPETHKAHVQRKEGLARGADGQDHAFRAVVTFLRPITIGAHDRITLWDGTTGPIVLPHGGKSNPALGGPFVHTVYVGTR